MALWSGVTVLTKTTMARESSTNPSSDGAYCDTLGSSLRTAELLNLRPAEDKPDGEDADRSFLFFCARPPHWSDHLPDGLADENGPGEPWALLSSRLTFQGLQLQGLLFL